MRKLMDRYELQYRATEFFWTALFVALGVVGLAAVGFMLYVITDARGLR
jgi:hypothetical protein